MSSEADIERAGRRIAIRKVWPKYVIMCCMYGKDKVIGIMKEGEQDELTKELIRRLERMMIK